MKKVNINNYLCLRNYNERTFYKKGNAIIGLTIFGVEDKLDSIETYLSEIEKSKEFSSYKSNLLNKNF